jgi:hypothetical protein
MAISLEIESTASAAVWTRTNALRWSVPADGGAPVLQQLWERTNGRRAWRVVATHQGPAAQPAADTPPADG